MILNNHSAMGPRVTLPEQDQESVRRDENSGNSNDARGVEDAKQRVHNTEKDSVADKQSNQH